MVALIHPVCLDGRSPSIVTKRLAKLDGDFRMHIDAGFTCTQKLLAAVFLYVVLHIFASCVYNRLAGTPIRPFPMSNLTILSNYSLIDDSRLAAARNQCVLPLFGE
ncbi:unnamed protein product [Dibothriocephalus latus]|uniref:Uncharacterized protein n=1 Tax=Dibothriocephalus latus TaxID=60516 RepID=A0A3P7L2L9_DIBLA|nr:unnamed protein product [Dibothriocephalus latus]